METLPVREATNHINSLRLQSQLGNEERQALFLKDQVGLAPDAVKNSRQIPLTIRNPKVLNQLSEMDGNLADWGKYETEPFHTCRAPHYHHKFSQIIDHKNMFIIQSILTLSS